MDAMAGAAVQHGMFALVLFELFYLRAVAGKARIGYRTAEGDFFWRVRVFMAPQAVLEIEMGFAAVALAAYRDIILARRPVAAVAAHASKTFVRPAVCSHFCRLWCVAFYAVAFGQRRGWGRLRLRKDDTGESEEDQDGKKSVPHGLATTPTPRFHFSSFFEQKKFRAVEPAYIPDISRFFKLVRRIKIMHRKSQGVNRPRLSKTCLLIKLTGSQADKLTRQQAGCHVSG
jgi:hypothetical protein